MRLYLAELPVLQQLHRVLLVDDDVIFQRDLEALYYETVDRGKLLRASCEMYSFASKAGVTWLNLSYATKSYGDTHFIGSIGPTAYPVCETGSDDPCAPKALEPLLTSLQASINGNTPRTLRDEVAWNFGVALLPLDRWREQRVALRATRWFEANSRHRLFAPDSVASGLGIPYLLFAGAVECWPEEALLDGLGYVSREDLLLSGVQDLKQYTALHFAGPAKLGTQGLTDYSPAAMEPLILQHLSLAVARRQLDVDAYGGIYYYLPPPTPPPLTPPPPPPPPPPSPIILNPDPDLSDLTLASPPPASPPPPTPLDYPELCEPGICTGNPFETCFYDPSCATGGLGCAAGGKPLCRFCGFGDFAATVACPGGVLPPSSPALDYPELCEPGSCTGNPFETCFYDPNCATGGLGCAAGGKPLCRFCGFGGYIDVQCPG